LVVGTELVELFEDEVLDFDPEVFFEALEPGLELVDEPLVLD
jgi:hypothetical protein